MFWLIIIVLEFVVSGEEIKQQGWFSWLPIIKWSKTKVNRGVD